MTYQRGDVVLIPFPYTDLSARKTRPAIVVSGEIFHARRSEILLMYVSSQVQKADPALDYLLEDWREAKLLKPSFARPKVAAVEPSLIVYQIGALTTRDLRGVAITLLKAFELEVALLAEADLTTVSPALVQSLAENSLAAAVALAPDADKGIDLSVLQQLLSVTG